MPQGGGPKPPQQQGYRPPQGYPPQQQSYRPQQQGYPPPQGYPLQQGYPPQQGGMPLQVHSPQQQGMPPQQGYPPQLSQAQAELRAAEDAAPAKTMKPKSARLAAAEKERQAAVSQDQAERRKAKEAAQAKTTKLKSTRQALIKKADEERNLLSQQCKHEPQHGSSEAAPNAPRAGTRAHPQSAPFEGPGQPATCLDEEERGQLMTHGLNPLDRQTDVTKARGNIPSLSLPVGCNVREGKENSSLATSISRNRQQASQRRVPTPKLSDSVGYTVSKAPAHWI